MTERHIARIVGLAQDDIDTSPKTRTFKSLSNSQLQQLDLYLESNAQKRHKPHLKIVDIKAYIAEEFDVVLSDTTVRDMMRYLDYNYEKVKFFELENGHDRSDVIEYRRIYNEKKRALRRPNVACFYGDETFVRQLGAGGGVERRASDPLSLSLAPPLSYQIHCSAQESMAWVKTGHVGDGAAKQKGERLCLNGHMLEGFTIQRKGLVLRKIESQLLLNDDEHLVGGHFVAAKDMQFDSDAMVIAFSLVCDQVISMFNKFKGDYKDVEVVFIEDNARTHSAVAPGFVDVWSMNLLS